MFKGILTKIVGKVVKNPLKRRLIVEMADDLAKRELDKRTGGLASKVCTCGSNEACPRCP